ncbi:CAP10 domain-containing protein [Favolaschia claudopus]|uniref:CAP10 domain-containing protein n=1 Tax=Favolaschia claudopus TaxID=2862362 RepID=A0AAW0BCH0_9AGAR
MAPSYFAPPGDESTTALLPATRSHKDMTADSSNSPDVPSLVKAPFPRRSASCRYWMPFVGVLALLGLASSVLYIPSRRGPPPMDIASPQPPQQSQQPHRMNETDVMAMISDLELSSAGIKAQQSIFELLERQSRTLEQATSRYSLKSGRSPPPNFDKWFEFAKENQCLIDEYDQIHRDFEPFYQIAQSHPNYFRTMVESGRNMTLQDPRGLMTIAISNGEVRMPEYQGTSFDGELQTILEQFARVLPDMEFLLNGRDEPRVVYDVRAAGAEEDAVRLKDPDPFRISPVPTSDFFRKQSGCDVSNAPTGFVSDPVKDIAFLHSSSSSDFTTDLWPVLSMTKISPCFSDILFPGVYYYDKTWWSGHFAHPNNVRWANKKPVIYWRGMSNGGHIYGQNYRSFPRFRLIELARNHSDLIDARMTAFAETHCTEDCDRSSIIQEYAIQGPGAPREEAYRYKYVLDIDGNTFSGRYLGLLRSGSLVFKSTAFGEFFSDWLKPYEHYIPVKIDLSDLTEKVEWARQNDEEARAIQMRGMMFAQRVMTDQQNDCYFSAVLLEWARLQNLAAGNETIVSGGLEEEEKDATTA